MLEQEEATKERIVITGAPGAGKTSIVRSLAVRGVPYSGEPARDILAEQRAIGGDGVWERDTRLFLELLLSRSIARFREAAHERVLYDRGIPDCLAYAQLAGLKFPAARRAAERYRYRPKIFIAPPWPEIYTNDAERTMSFAATCLFHDYLVEAYESLGYELVPIPFGTVEERAAFFLSETSW